MNLSKLLTPERIVFLNGADKPSVIGELIDVLHRDKALKDRDMALCDVMARENYLSTGMEHGLAVPHAKTDAVDELVVSFGLHRAGLDFESLDGRPAHFIFLVLSPRSTSGPHIQALARITRGLKDEENRRALLQARNLGELTRILTGQDVS